MKTDISLTAKKYNLYLVYSDYSTGGEICEDMENDSWRPSFEPTYHDFRLLSAHHRQNSKEEQLPYDRHKEEISFDPKNKTIYVVLVRYGEGDTFSSSHGLGHIEGVYEHLGQAQKIATAIENKTYFSKRGYLPWDCYFGGLENASVVPLLVQE